MAYNLIQTMVLRELEQEFFPTAPEDTLPENTLVMPVEKWGEKFPALARRAFSYFQAGGVVPETLSSDRIAEYKAFLERWGKPWRLYFLRTAFDSNELRMIWDEAIVVQADTPEELADSTDVTSHFAKPEDVQHAINEGRLMLITAENINMDEI